MVWVTVIAPVFLLETAQPIEPLADQLLSGELDPVTYDYGAIRFEAGDEVTGWERLGALERAVSLQVAPENVREGARLDIEQAGCEMTAVLGGVQLAKRAPDLASYEAAHDQGVALYQSAQAELDRRLQAAPSELDAAIIRDQFWRDLMLEPRDPALSGFAAEFELNVLYRGLCKSDRANGNYLRHLMADPQRLMTLIYGEDAPARADLVQHASASFQRDVIALMEASTTFGDALYQRRAQAFLTDRVRVAERQPQIYATQGQCVRGRWSYSHPVDLERARQERAEIGLEPLEVAREIHDRACQRRLGAALRDEF